MTVQSKEPLNCIIAGVGGQGNILASQVIASAALMKGIYATIGETYGVSQRGGSVMSHVRLSRDGTLGPLIPKGETDVLVGFEPLETLQVGLDYANARTHVVMNPRPVYPIGVLAGEWSYPPVERIIQLLRTHAASLHTLPATELARNAGEIRAMNLVMVGALAASGLLPLERELYEAALRNLFQGKVLEVNLNAFERGYQAGTRVA